MVLGGSGYGYTVDLSDDGVFGGCLGHGWCVWLGEGGTVAWRLRI